MIDFLRQLWGFVRPYRGRFFLGLLCGIFYGLVNGLLIGAVGWSSNWFSNGSTNLHAANSRRRRNGFIRFRTGWPRWCRNSRARREHTRLGAGHRRHPRHHAAAQHAGQYLSIYLTNWSAMHAIADIRTKLFSHLQNLSLGFFNRASTGDLIARITNDTQVLYGIVGSSFASAVKDPVTILCPAVVTSWRPTPR